MSFNMRTQVSNDGVNQFLNRKEFIAERLNEIKPDVIGCQEMKPVMYDWLVENLGDYYVVGGGRGINFDDEAVCIAFRKSRFTLFDCETFWLSPTPYKPGSRYSGDQSNCPRICTCVTLKPKDYSKLIRVYNVHTDHVGVSARILASNQVLQKISENNSKLPAKTFITGDFNDTPESLCIKAILDYNNGSLIDLSADSGLTFHGFGKYYDRNSKIDYIFADAGTNCLSFEVFKDMKGELFLSDHYPIMATVSLE
jgi:endonuclease/exonuclease/phosphatase family metal-dependent hydrolase